VGDHFYEHRFVVLVNETAAGDCLQALDEAYIHSSRRPPSEKASWFEGQQINIDVGGKYYDSWSTRDKSSNKFEELLQG
jgi:hypothetical protein